LEGAGGGKKDSGRRQKVCRLLSPSGGGRGRKEGFTN